MNRSQSKIRHIQEANILLEQRMLNEKSILNEQANDGWLTYQGDKNYLYKKVGNNWITKNVKTNKQYDLTKLSAQPRFAGYKQTIANLEKAFPGGKGPAGGQSSAATPSDSASTVSTSASTSSTSASTPSSSAATASTSAETQNNNQVQYKNETLPGSPVYYPWIHDGKFSVEKLTQSIEDNSIYKWIDVLKNLTPEQFAKVVSDFNALNINGSLTTKKGVGVYLATRDVLKSAQKWVDSAQQQQQQQRQQNINAQLKNPFQANNPLNNTLNNVPQFNANSSNPLLNKFNSQYNTKQPINRDMSGSINNPQNLA